METIQASNFSNRAELESHIAVVSAHTADPKPDFVITGTDAELRKLNLSHGKKCWGISVTATDAVETALPSYEFVERGKVADVTIEESVVDVVSSEEL
jgi:hypothetical protein